MRLSKLLVAVTTASMVAAPAFAAPLANPAASLSIAKATGVKSASTVRKGSKLEGTGIVVAVVAAAAVVGGIVAATSGGGGDSN